MSKKQIEETIERLKKASTSPEEKLKVMQELEVSLRKVNEMVKVIVVDMKKEVGN